MDFRKKYKLIPLEITVIYFIIGALWILLSDVILLRLVDDPKTLTILQIYKGWFYVLATAVLLYLLIRQNLKAIEHSENIIMESEAKYRNLVENIGDLVWEVNKDTVYIYASPRARDILGYKPEEMVGRALFDFVLPDQQKKIANVFDKRKSFKLLENVRVNKDGEQVILETSGAPIFDVQNCFRGYRGVDRDITFRKQAEKALRERDIAIRKAYSNVFSAVTGDRLIIVTKGEIEEALGIPVSNRYKISSYEELADARRRLREAIALEFPSIKIINDYVAAANEAIVNAVKHAGGGWYQVRRTEERAQIEICDAGPGIDFEALPKATLITGFSTKGSLGMGFTIMLEICDRVLLSTQPGDTTLALEIKLGITGT